MAAILGNLEIVTGICQAILPNDGLPFDEDALRESRSRLRNLALTSRIFREPALACLWSVIDSLVPLIKLLPDFGMERSASYVLRRLPDDCAFIRRARQVRVFNFTAHNAQVQQSTLPTHLYVLLAREFFSQPLFPALRKILLHPRSSNLLKSVFPALPILFTSLVTSLEVSGLYLSHSSFHRYCLQLAATNMANLKHLKLDAPRGSNDFCQPFLDFALSMSQLESLDFRTQTLTSLTPETLISLVRNLPRLKSLTLDVHFRNLDPDAHPEFSASSSDLGLDLSRLSTVQLFYRQDGSTHPCSDCIPRFLREHASTVTFVDVPHTSGRFTYESYINRVFANISFTPRIQTLSLIGNRTQFRPEDLARFVTECPNLEELQVPAGAVRYQEGDVSELLQGASQRLTTLALPPGDYTYASIYLDDLFDIADTSLGLRHLKIAVTSTGRDPDEPLLEYLLRARRIGRHADANTVASSLRILAVSDMRPDVSLNAGDCFKLGEIFDFLFPSLEAIRPYEETDVAAGYWVDCWAHIEEMRCIYQARREGRIAPIGER